MRWVDIAFKILSVLVVPVVIWGAKLEITNAVQREQIAQLKVEVDALKDLSTGLVRVEEQLNATNTRLQDIKSDLLRSLPVNP